MCRCRDCEGLGEFMLGVTGKDYGLPRARGHSPLVEAVDVCDGTLTCSCGRCAAERAARVRFGVRRPVQPWEARAA